MTHLSKQWLDRARAVWDDRAPSWDELSETNAAAPDRPADLKRTAEALRLTPGASLLDAGCGTGQFATAFAALGCHVTAVDLSPAMIARAEQHARRQGIDVTWRVGDMTRLPDPPAAFDAIHARMALLFVSDVAATLTEFRRVLKPDGRLYASVPGALSPIYRHSWRRFLDPAGASTNFITPWELEALLDEFGWTVIDEWGEYGQSLTSEQNPLTPSRIAALDRRLHQAAATTWTMIASR